MHRLYQWWPHDGDAGTASHPGGCGGSPSDRALLDLGNGGDPRLVDDGGVPVLEDKVTIFHASAENGVHARWRMEPDGAWHPYG